MAEIFGEGRVPLLNGDFSIIRDVCGDEIAAALSREFPGVRVYIPKHLNETTRVGATTPLLCIGRAAAEELSARFGGASVYVPRDPRGRAGRCAAVAAAIGAGLTTRAAALAAGCSERLVQSIRAKADRSVSDAPLTGGRTKVRHPTSGQGAKRASGRPNRSYASAGNQA